MCSQSVINFGDVKMFAKSLFHSYTVRPISTRKMTQCLWFYTTTEEFKSNDQDLAMALGEKRLPECYAKV